MKDKEIMQDLKPAKTYSSSPICPICGAYNDIESKHFGILIGKEMVCVKCGSKLAVLEKPRSIFLKLFSVACVFFIYALLRPIMNRHGLRFFMYVLTLVSSGLIVLIIDFKFRNKYIIIPYADKKTLNRIKLINIFFISLAILFAILIMVFLDGNRYKCN